MSVALQHIQDIILKHGWAATGTVSDNGTPFTYSIPDEDGFNKKFSQCFMNSMPDHIIAKN